MDLRTPAYPIVHGCLRRRWRAAPAEVWCSPDAEPAVRARFPAPTLVVVDEDIPAGKFRIVPGAAPAQRLLTAQPAQEALPPISS